MEYKHTEDMGEISGFGGGYEATCQNMLNAGVQWLLANPEKNPNFKEYENIYGLTCDENEDMKELQDILLKASGDDCTRAMMQCVSSRLLFIKANNWDKYCDALRKQELTDHPPTPSPAPSEK